MAPELMDEIVEEILIRCPPDDPARLLRAALVCRRWCRVASDPGFRRRFAQRHRAAPMLGFLCHLKDDNLYHTARFVPAHAFRPRRAVVPRRCALDARHGRVLLYDMHLDTFCFVVWDPITDEEWDLPKLPLHMSPCSWNAAVLCAGASGGCNHLCCHCGHFLVVFVGAARGERLSCVFSSEAGAWGTPASFHLPAENRGLRLAPSALVGNALHFVILYSGSAKILKYDLATEKMSVMTLPPVAFNTHIMLMTTEDNRLGFATIRQSKLYLWSREDSPDTDAGWEQSRVIELETLIHTDVLSISPHVVGYADGIGVIFLGTEVGYFTIDLNTSRVKKVVEDAGFFGVFPFVSFYTPALGADSTDGPRVDASTASQA